jgi:hypothetical protein
LNRCFGSPFALDEVPSDLKAFFSVRNHGSLLGHIQGQGIVDAIMATPRARILLHKIMKRNKISAFNETIFFNTAFDPIAKLLFGFQKGMEFPGVAGLHVCPVDTGFGNGNQLVSHTFVLDNLPYRPALPGNRAVPGDFSLE